MLFSDKLFLKKYKKFIKQDNYISQKKLKQFQLKNAILIKSIKNNIYYSNEINIVLDILENIDSYVKKHNDIFLKRKLIELKGYFDNMFKTVDPNINLDIEQRKAILTEEDYSIIVAGAGSGKTTTMVAKAKYLVEKLNIDPADIIVISYTNKAVLELKNRINKDFKIPVQGCTFHKFGLDILKKTSNKHLKILTNSYNIIENYFNQKLCYDNKLLKEFLHFFFYYFDIPTSALKFKSLNEYHQYKKRNDYITLKTRLDKFNKETIKKQIETKKTIRGEFLKSSEEVMIANFLYMNNIKYDYEKPYPHLSKGKTYFPDFTIYFGEQTFYLEHYGIPEIELNNKYSKKINLYYRRDIAYKSRLHFKHKTQLLKTYSKYNDGLDLLEHLKIELEKNNIILRKKSEKEIFKQLSENNKDIYYTRFIYFCMDFLQNYKNLGFKLKDIDNLLEQYKKDNRTVKFLNFFKGLYNHYQMELKLNNLIDFEDMINLSYKLLKQIKKTEANLNYKYIIIDEYQDISIQRFNLTKEVSHLSGAKVVAVGDDWQAVFAFAGSDVTLFTEFKKLMGYGEELQITNTYRNSQELIDIAGKFILKNKDQIKKKLKSKKRLSKPVIIYNYEKKQYAKVVDNCIKKIVLEYGDDSSILLIGRYNFDKYHLLKSKLFYEYEQDKIKSLNYPNVLITFLTAHSSKGLGFDNVIILNGTDGIYGFPSQVKNDPIMDIVKIKDNSFQHAEERRLFYVALTRTKNKVHIIAPKNNPSSFLIELKNYPNVVTKNISKKDFGTRKDICPKCGFPLLKRPNNSYNITNLYECSNEKELCNFKTNNLTFKKNIENCPKCKTGYLIVKQNKEDKNYFLGCTNYNKHKCMKIKRL